MVIYAAHHDRVAAAGRQSAPACLRFEYRHIAELGGGDGLAKPLQPFWVNLRGKDMPCRSREGEAQLPFAGADIRYHGAPLEVEYCLEARHFRSVGMKAAARPMASRAKR